MKKKSLMQQPLLEANNSGTAWHYPTSVDLAGQFSPAVHFVPLLQLAAGGSVSPVCLECCAYGQ